MIGTLDPGLVERFRSDVEALFAGSGRLALAVSGGPDSMAMLALAAIAFPGRVTAATVDHRLRAASASEAEMVAGFAQMLGIDHAVLVPAEPITGASVQAQARAARYALLVNWAKEADAAALLTAHHADDQAETFLMRAARGSGVPGLAGIRARRALAPDLLLLRPLLGWRRAELRALAEAQGLPFVDDPSNRDPMHDRTRFRALLEADPLLDIAGLAASARFVAEAEEALEVVADRCWADREAQEARVTIAVAGLPREIARRLARRAIGEVRRVAAIRAPAWSDAVNIEPLLDALEAGRAATQAGVKAAPKGKYWLFSPAPPRRSH